MLIFSTLSSSLYQFATGRKGKGGGAILGTVPEGEAGCFRVARDPGGTREPRLISTIKMVDFEGGAVLDSLVSPKECGRVELRLDHRKRIFSALGHHAANHCHFSRSIHRHPVRLRALFVPGQLSRGEALDRKNVV